MRARSDSRATALVSILAGLLVLSGARAAEPRVRILSPKAGAVITAADGQVRVVVALGRRFRPKDNAVVSLEWQKCPEPPGDGPKPCDATADGRDVWGERGRRYFSFGARRRFAWFLAHGGVGRWRVRAGLAGAGRPSAWRDFRIRTAIARLEGRSTRPRILAPRPGQRVGGAVTLVIAPAVRAPAICAAAGFDLEWRWRPPTGPGTAPPSWTPLQRLPRRLPCDPVKGARATLPRADFETGVHYVRARHAWPDGHGLWSRWRTFYMPALAGQDARPDR